MSVLCWLSTLIGQSKPKLVSRTRRRHSGREKVCALRYLTSCRRGVSFARAVVRSLIG